MTLQSRVELALEALRKGSMVILTDDPDRENEGDLIIPAETITSEKMNFIVRNGTGIVCIALPESRLQALNLPLMVEPGNNTTSNGTPFTVPVDAKTGTTTGVSAADRVTTVQCLLDEKTQPDDLVRPGHMFPLQAHKLGVLGRRGHTEGALDLAQLAGFKPAAVLCEIMNADGTMARGNQLTDFAHQHNLPILSIAELVHYRLSHENVIAESATAQLPIDHYGTFEITVIKEKINQTEHTVLFKQPVEATKPLLVRIHSSCATGDLFASRRCDCHQQLHHALQRIGQEGGMLIYLNQEGRGIGLLNKIKAYALQNQGFDTVEANQELGLPVDSRQYYIAANILRNANISAIRLLTNNPAKIAELTQYGIAQIEREIMPTFDDLHNQYYLKTKKEKLRHAINLDMTCLRPSSND